MDSKDKYIKKLKDLYLQKEGEELSDDKALMLFENLITLVDTIYRTIKKYHG